MIDLRSVKLFAFDFDGTLVWSNKIKRATFYEVTANFPSAHALLDRLFDSKPNLDRYGICAALAGQIEGIDAGALAQRYTDRCEELIVAEPSIPGVSELLLALREKGRVAVINSATPEQPLRRLAARMSFAPHIDAVYGKPASKVENLRKAMASYGCSEPEIMVVGDGDDDRRTAEEIGCAFVAIASDNNAFTKPPKVMIRRLDEMVGWL